MSWNGDCGPPRGKGRNLPDFFLMPQCMRGALGNTGIDLAGRGNSPRGWATVVRLSARDAGRLITLREVLGRVLGEKASGSFLGQRLCKREGLRRIVREEGMPHERRVFMGGSYHRLACGLFYIFHRS